MVQNTRAYSPAEAPKGAGELDHTDFNSRAFSFSRADALTCRVRGSNAACDSNSGAVAGKHQTSAGARRRIMRTLHRLHHWHSGCAPDFQSGYRGSIPLWCSNFSRAGIAEEALHVWDSSPLNKEATFIAADGSTPSPAPNFAPLTAPDAGVDSGWLCRRVRGGEFKTHGGDTEREKFERMAELADAAGGIATRPVSTLSRGDAGSTPASLTRTTTAPCAGDVKPVESRALSLSLVWRGLATRTSRNPGDWTARRSEVQILQPRANHRVPGSSSRKLSGTGVLLPRRHDVKQRGVLLSLAESFHSYVKADEPGGAIWTTGWWRFQFHWRQADRFGSLARVSTCREHHACVRVVGLLASSQKQADMVTPSRPRALVLRITCAATARLRHTASEGFPTVGSADTSA